MLVILSLVVTDLIEDFAFGDRDAASDCQDRPKSSASLLKPGPHWFGPEVNRP